MCSKVLINTSYTCTKEYWSLKFISETTKFLKIWNTIRKIFNWFSQTSKSFTDFFKHCSDVKQEVDTKPQNTIDIRCQRTANGILRVHFHHRCVRMCEGCVCYEPIDSFVLREVGKWRLYWFLKYTPIPTHPCTSEA